MLVHERELLVSRIVSGRLRFEDYYIGRPSAILKEKAEELYSETLRNAELEGVLLTEELEYILAHYGIWTDVDETTLKGINKDIETLKINLYNSHYRSNDTKQIKDLLGKAKDKQISYLSRKHSHYHLTAAGCAFLAKTRYLIGRCLFKLKQRLFKTEKEYWDYDGNLIDLALDHYNATRLNETQLRELARTDPWQSYYNCSKTPFGKSIISLSEDQRSLLLWSKTYENVRKHPERPSESAIADDDMLDGWFIIQRKKQSREENKAKAEGLLTNEKIRNSQEVFIMAQTRDDIEAIDDLNDVGGQTVKRQRFNKIKKQGTVSEQEFADSQLQIRMQAAQQFSQAVKGQ